MVSRIVTVVVVLVGLAVLVVPAVVGWSYYTMPIEKRIRLPKEQRSLRSSGSVGHMLGYVGTGIMLLNFLYLFRKRLGERAARFGNMRQWMHFHVFVGLVGPILIFYHTAFVMSNVFAKVSLIALIIVVITGIFGRFIYATIPRDSEGNEQTQAELELSLMNTLELLEGQEDDHTHVDERLKEWLPPPTLDKHNAIFLLLFLFGEQLRLVPRRARATKILMAEFSLGKQEARILADLWLKSRRFSFLVEVLDRHRKTLSSWRALHRTLTYLMVLTAVVHVFIATVGFGLL